MTTKPLYEIAKDRDEFDLYRADPLLYAAMVAEEDVAAAPTEKLSLAARWANRPGVNIVWEPELPDALDPETFPTLPWKDAEDGSTLSLLPPIGPGAVTGAISATIEQPLRFDVQSLDQPPLTLRRVVETLGYEVTPEMDAILTDNPAGPWTLDDLETLFAADAQGDHPHGVEFQIVSGGE